MAKRKRLSKDEREAQARRALVLREMDRIENGGVPPFMSMAAALNAITKKVIKDHGGELERRRKLLETLQNKGRVTFDTGTKYEWDVKRQ